MDVAFLQSLIASGESLTLEFKGEERTALNDRDLTAAIVCLANAQGGTLLVGVEDDRRVTGAKPRHQTSTDLNRLQALVRSRIVPSIEISAVLVSLNQKEVLVISVPRASAVVATSDGLCVRRVMGANGPECLPFYPHQQGGHGLALGAEDFTAHTCLAAGWEGLDPLQFERARRTIAALRGDTVLLSLDDREMAKALRVVETREGILVPNFAGILLFGREATLRDHLPTHQAAFQVLDAGADVRVNEFFRLPLIELAERYLERFDARVEEREVQVGLVRLPVPDYARIAFREALLNALFHRDFRRLGTVHVQWFPDRLEISSPGGFPEGVTAGNLLTHEPLPRNARLYEAAKRLGLVEQTGRGVDKVFLGQLRYGRPAPDYSRSDGTGVRLALRGGRDSLEFAAFVFQQEREHGPITVEEMLVLHRLFRDRRLITDDAAAEIQRSPAEARAILERWVERGVIEAKGERRGRIYHFSATLYRHLGKPENYVRVHGIDSLRQEGLVLQLAESEGKVRREHVMKLCGLDKDEAYRLLRRLAKDGKLKAEGERRGRIYRPVQPKAPSP
jgi:ATP-dependent DNA helicase RecG